MTTSFFNVTTGKVNFSTVNSIVEFKAAAQAAIDAGFIAIDARKAYASATNDNRLNIEAVNLKHIFETLARLFEQTGKSAGVSTIYNVIDARKVRGVQYTHKLATGLGSSLKLAEFAGLVAHAQRATTDRVVRSTNGVEYVQNRNTYATQRINVKGKLVSIRNAQHGNDRKAILSGQAMPILAKPNKNRRNLLITIFNNIFDKQIALPENTSRKRGNANKAITENVIAMA